jgi:hypothetical protein
MRRKSDNQLIRWARTRPTETERVCVFLVPTLGALGVGTRKTLLLILANSPSLLPIHLSRRHNHPVGQ